ncbi:MAG: hypothetical protein EG824_04450 [Deltaproteobacteria bacterium]|nr:hypothetical protein [Deltaproteobacteria bacterium]
MALQTISGLLLDFGLFRRGLAGPGSVESTGMLNQFLVTVHFGPGWLGSTYHILLGVGIIWMAVSGWIVFLRLRRNLRKKPATETTL